MIAQELAQTIKCPTCQWQITIYMTDLRGRLRLQCNHCNRTLLDWVDGKPQTARNPLESTLPKEMQFLQDAVSPVPLPASPYMNAERNVRSEVMVSDKDSALKNLKGLDPVPVPGELKKVGDYTLLKLIASGAMGEVYLGQHSGKSSAGKIIPPQVAIKVLSEKIQTDTAARERFLQEAQVHSRLCKDSVHPNIVQIYDVGYCTKSGRLYLVMEYIEGESLEKFLVSREKLSERHSLQIAMGVAHALEHAFKYHIIHRDLKPANILIDRRSRKAKVADLGLGKILEEKGVTVNGEFMGTPYYMAPEQIRNAKDVDQQADIYALGATVYHMLTGRPPYAEFKRTLDILRAKIAQDPIPMSEFVPAIGESMVDFVDKAMARDKKNRYETPTQIIGDMQKILETVKVER
jgi:serine/threonine-protein kinase